MPQRASGNRREHLPSELLPCPRRPPCDVLLDTNWDDLPDHVSAEVALSSVLGFADRCLPLGIGYAFNRALGARAGESPADERLLAVTDLRVAAFYFAWRIDWPLLVGPATDSDLDHLLAIAQLVQRSWGLDSSPVLAPLPGPFVSEPGARAGFVLERRYPEGRVLLFGLVREARCPAVRMSGPSGNRLWHFEWASPPEGELREPVVVLENEALAEHAKRLRRWYDQYLLGRVVRGRPPGTQVYDRDKFEKEYRQVYAKLLEQGYRPSQAQMAWELGISERTLRHYLERWGFPWPPL